VLGDAAIEEPVYLELFDGGTATQALADRVADTLSRATGRRHECRLIPPCADPAEQADFVALLSGELKPKDRIVLDLTHGLRNQSLMLAQSALMLEGAFGVHIEGLYYGGLEIPRETGGPAPAVDLTGLLVQARLAQALAAFRQSGDVRVLVEHLPQGGFRKQIENLGHSVAIHDYAQAPRYAQQALAELDNTEVGALKQAIQAALKSHLGDLAQSQYAQARKHLERNAWIEGITAMFEGAISELANDWGLRTDRFQGQREEAKKALYWQSGTFQALSILRNQVAHGIVDPSNAKFHMAWGETISRNELLQRAKNPEQLKKLLSRILEILPGEVSCMRKPPMAPRPTEIP
jgi:hypothetical protein